MIINGLTKESKCKEKNDKNVKTIKSDIVKTTNKMNDTRYCNGLNKYYIKYTPKAIINLVVDKIIK